MAFPALHDSPAGRIFPAIAEWLGARRIRKILSGMTIAAVIFRHHLIDAASVGIRGFIPDGQGKDTPALVFRIHPDPVLCSSIFAGLSMVILKVR